MVRDFETGGSTANVAEVMVAMQKASLSFTAMTQVRNRLVEAYQEIMNMPIDRPRSDRRGKSNGSRTWQLKRAQIHRWRATGHTVRRRWRKIRWRH